MRRLTALFLLIPVIFCAACFEETGFKIVIPEVTYKQMYKAGEGRFEYTQIRGGVIDVKALVRYERRKKKEYFFIKKIQPRLNTPLAAGEILLIKKGKKCYILFPEREKYLECGKPWPLIKFIDVRIKNAVKKPCGNIVVEGKVYKKYPLSGTEGYITRDDGGEIGELSFPGAENEKHKLVFAGIERADFKWRGRYLLKETMPQIFVPESILFKDILKNHGRLFDYDNP